MPGLGRAPPGRGPTAAGSATGARARGGAGTALRTRHALAGRERVVAGTRAPPPSRATLTARAHALAGRERVVARARGAGAGRAGTRGSRAGTRARVPGRGDGGTPGPCWPPSRADCTSARARGRRGRGSRGSRAAGPGARRSGRCRRRGPPGPRRGVPGRGAAGAGAAGAAAGAAGPRAAGAAGVAARGGLVAGAAWLRPWPWRRLAGAPRGTSRRLADDRGLDGRAGGLDVLAHAVQVVEQGLAVSAELFGERAYTDLGHVSPVPGPCSGQARTVVTAGGCSLLSSHRVLISVKPAFGSLAWTVGEVLLLVAAALDVGRRPLPGRGRRCCAARARTPGGGGPARDSRRWGAAMRHAPAGDAAGPAASRTGSGLIRLRDHSQECRPAIRPAAPHTRPGRVPVRVLEGRGAMPRAGVQSGRSPPVYRPYGRAAPASSAARSGRPGRPRRARRGRCPGGCRCASR